MQRARYDDNGCAGPVLDGLVPISLNFGALNIQ